MALSGKRGWNSEKGYKGGSFVVLRKVEGVFSPFGERSCPLQTQSGRSNHGPQDTCLSLVFPVWHGMVSLPNFVNGNKEKCTGPNSVQCA